MTEYRYLTPARNELRSAALYYNQRSPRAAASFMQAVQAAIDQVVQFPESAEVIRGKVRARVVARFPYSLLYRIEGDTIVILAVAHHRQRPDYWVHRVR